MDAVSITTSMRARMPWPIGRRILALHDLPRGHGWDKTLDHIGSQDAADTISELTEALRQHLLSGEKLVRFYRSTPNAIQELRARLADLIPPEGKARDAYPELMSSEDLLTEDLSIKFVANEASEAGTAIVFSSVRVMTVRESFEPEDLPSEAQDRLSGYEEIYGIKHIRTQAFDVVWLPAEGNYIDVRVDYPLGTIREIGVAAQELISRAFGELVGGDFLGVCLNLFPLISPMYNNEQEGMVVELAFGTTTASLKHEKMRRRSSCLRQEHYHRAGKAALTAPIEPFKLSIAWRRNGDSGLSTQPELSLHSSSRASGASDTVLADAVVRKCIDIEDFGFVRSRVEAYLDGLTGEQIAAQVL